MAYKKKLYREPLSKELTKALLTTAGTSLAETLEQVRVTLHDTIEKARIHLEVNPLTPIVAQSVTKELGRRGDATVVVGDDGVVMLEIQYGGNGNARDWKSDLPSLQEFRRQAEEKGVDISHLGRNKRQIQELLDKST